MASSPKTPASGGGYDASAIKNLAPRDHVRLRPSTYIGGTSSSALVHLVDEILANCADEAIGGHAKNTWVTIRTDNSVTVRDDGRGVPIGETKLHSGKRVPTVQAAFTEMLTGGKYATDEEGGSYEGGSGGLNGMGAKAVVFTSRWTKVEVRRDGLIYTQTYRNGRVGEKDDILTIEPPVQKPYAGKDTGTTVAFLYDDSVFDADAHMDGERIKRKCYNLSRLIPGFVLHFEDERAKEKVTFESKRGLVDFVAELNDGESVIFKDIVSLDATRQVEDSNSQPVTIRVQTAFQPIAAETSEERGSAFTNLVHNPDGGTHVAGFRKGLTRALNDHFRKAGLLKPADAGFEGSDVTGSGLGYVLSIRTSANAIQYMSQTKRELSSTWVDSAVGNIVADAAREWLSDHPVPAKLWFTYLTAIRKARLDMMAERKAVKAKVGGSGLDPLISKLARETTKDPERAEIYFVEGDSAGGSAKQARDRSHQAILPFRGKMLNVLTADRKKALENEDVRRIATAIETGLGQHFDLEKLRYHKIIFMADADADGGHIVMLWATAFFAMFPEVLRKGHCYIAIPPLFSVYDYKTKERAYFYDRKELAAWQKGRPANSYTVTRFKGLGEMKADHLEETAMNPATRRLRQIVVEDFAEMKALINSLMGNKASERRAFMDANCRGMSTRSDVQEAA